VSAGLAMAAAECGADIERVERELRGAMARMRDSGWRFGPYFRMRVDGHPQCCAIGALAESFYEAERLLAIPYEAVLDIGFGFDEQPGDLAAELGEEAVTPWHRLGARLRAFGDQLHQQSAAAAGGAS